MVAINLQYEGGTEALHVRAVGQLLAKLLFAAGPLVSKDPPGIGKEAAEILGVRKISPELVLQGLAFLHTLSIAKESHGRWLLTPSGRSAIQTDVERARTRLRRVLGRHFPGAIPEAMLAAWFNDACVEFYGMYGSQWAAALGRKVAPRLLTRDAVRELLSAAIARHNLEPDAGALVVGFHGFLASQDRDDVEHNWSLCQSLLAAKLVAANIGPDPVTVREFTNTRFLLDTNMLLVTALEADRLAEALELLGSALRSMGAEFGYIAETRDEYTRVVAPRKQDVMRAFDRFPLSILRDSNDAFVNTALARHCQSASDLEVFFDSLLDPPTTLGDNVPVLSFNDDRVTALAHQGSTDDKLKAEISGLWKQLRNRPKRSRAAEHDAALTAVAEGLRKDGIPCAVLTLDRTMHEHARTRAGKHGLPQWISLDALIQVLAVDGAGPQLDPASFAPLMASIIRHQCDPMLDTYRAEDLALMLDVEDRCAALPPDQAKQIALTVARERLAGRRRDDPELVLAVRRAFQSGTFRLADNAAAMEARLQQSSADLRSRDDQISSERQRNSRLGEMHIASRVLELKAVARRNVLERSIVALIGLSIWSLIAWFLTAYFINDRKSGFVALFAALLAPDLAIVTWLFGRVIPDWRADVISAPTVAAEETRNLMN